jgi:hypothetical protein
VDTQSVPFGDYDGIHEKLCPPCAPYFLVRRQLGGCTKCTRRTLVRGIAFFRSWISKYKASARGMPRGSCGTGHYQCRPIRCCPSDSNDSGGGHPAAFTRLKNTK